MIERIKDRIGRAFKRPLPTFLWPGNLFLSIGFAVLLTAWLVQIPEPPVIEVFSPLPGQALQGNFPIRATIRVPGFETGVLSFRYTEDLTGSWFELAQFQDGLEDTELIIWDTTALTDGNYDLQIVITRAEKDPLIVTVAGLRVRNYSLIEPNTPAPTITLAPNITATRQPTATPPPAPVRATPTALPPNPAEIRQGDIGTSLLNGIVTSLVIFGAIGLLLVLRAVTRR